MTAPEQDPMVVGIAQIIDHPSVYMGGPSRNSLRIAEAIVKGFGADLCASGQQVQALGVDDLAQIIRVVDGNNTLGAGELAEAILEAMPVPRIVGALTPAPQAEGHPDDLAVDRFAAAMKAKLAKKRAEGRGGWDRKDECSAEDLSYMLVQHLWKGDPLDVGNLAMMLHQRGERIVLDGEAKNIVPQPAGEAVPTCFACEDSPKHPNIPCAVCGAHPPQPSETVAEAAVEAAFKALPPDAHGTIGSGEMERVLEAAFRAQLGAPVNDALKRLVSVLDQNDEKGPIPDTALMFCWMAAQDVRAALRALKGSDK